jgi:hypothetical protein
MSANSPPPFLLPWERRYVFEYHVQNINKDKTIAIVIKQSDQLWSLFIFDERIYHNTQYTARMRNIQHTDAINECDKFLHELGYRFISKERAEKIGLLL